MNDLLGAVQGSEGTVDNGGSTLDNSLQDFLSMVDDIKTDMNKIREKRKAIYELHEQSLVVATSEGVKNLRSQMQQEINVVSQQAHAIKAKLEALDKANREALQREGCQPGSSSERMRTSITAGLKKRLKDLMSDFTELRQKVQHEYRDAVGRIVSTVKGTAASEEEIDRLIEEGEAENVFQNAIKEQGKGKALDTLVEIRERQNAVKDLEQSLLELHQIFLDMAVLVEAQGEMLDNIERQVAQSVEYVGNAVVAITEARKSQRSTRKLMCCAMICLLIVIAIVVVGFLVIWN